MHFALSFYFAVLILSSQMPAMHYRAWAPPAACSHLLFLPHYRDTKHFVKIVHFITAIKKIVISGKLPVVVKLKHLS